MAWGLPFPLGASATRARLLYERWVLQKVPPWLRRRVGAAILQSIGEVADALVDRAGIAVRLRFPLTDESSLALLGSERGIVRGPDEAPLVYAGRVQRWLEAHRHRGGVYELLDQWNAYNPTRRAIDVLYASGTLYRFFEADLPIDRQIIFWGESNSPVWARAWCFLYEDADPGPLTPAEETNLTIIPRLWNAAHMLPLYVVVLWPGVKLWDYPQEIWDEPGAVWTDDEPIILEAS